MRFHVLGVVDAVHDGKQVNLGHTRLRCVLAGLLVEANRVISTDQLMERVWGDRPPQRGRAVLYTYLSRLRAIFSADPTVTIERRSGGYLLVVDAASVDLHQFRGLIRQAREADDDTRALALYDQALRLWGGTPFAGLDTPWLASVRAALELEREAAELDRTDVALRCGQYVPLLADLRARVAHQPLDERVAGQLMLALAGAGRPADALSAYQRTRQALVDQLGLEPGPDLRRLHERILAGDAPAEPVPPTARSGVVVPRQLPAGARHFTGRQVELDRLADFLASAQTASDAVGISVIDGMAGVGKTALAVHTAHRLADRFPDGVLFADLCGFTPDVDPLLPEQVLDHLLRGLGVPGTRIPPDLEGRAGLYRSVLAGCRVLVVLDNAAHETQLQPLLPATAGCAVIVTSRRRLAGLDDAVHLTLPVLRPAESAGLFGGLAGDRVTRSDRPTVDRIVALCGGLPLAVRIAAARLRLANGNPAALCAELEDALHTGSGLEWLSDGHRAIGAALAVSFRHLTAGQQRVLRFTGLHPGPSLEPYAVAALADTTIHDARRLLDDLHSANLISQPTYRRYAMHDLVAAYARTLAVELPEAERRAALGRLYDHYAATGSRAMDVSRPWEADHRPRPPASDTPAPPLADRDQAQAWLDAEIDSLLATAQHAATHHRADHTRHQSFILHRHLLTRGQFNQAVLLHQQARDSARQAGDHTGEQEALNCLGHVHELQGRYGPAIECFEQALAGAHRTGNRAGEQEALSDLGVVRFLQGRYEQAADCLERALAIAREIGVREHPSLVGLGHVHLLQGRYEQAAGCFEQALASARRAGNRNGQFEAYQGLGRIRHVAGDHDGALGHQQTALHLALDLDQPADQARAHDALAHTHRAMDHPDQARRHWRTALHLLTTIGADQTQEPSVTTTAIRTHLLDLDKAAQ